MKKYREAFVLLPVLALVLELLPYGAVLNFANPEGEPFRRTYSYFSLEPFGYANFGPLVTAILTCAITILTVTWIFNRSKVLGRVIAVLGAAASVASITPLLYGFESISVVGALISAVLIGQTAMVVIYNKRT